MTQTTRSRPWTNHTKLSRNVTLRRFFLPSTRPLNFLPQIHLGSHRFNSSGKIASVDLFWHTRCMAGWLASSLLYLWPPFVLRIFCATLRVEKDGRSCLVAGYHTSHNLQVCGMQKSAEESHITNPGSTPFFQVTLLPQVSRRFFFCSRGRQRSGVSPGRFKDSAGAFWDASSWTKTNHNSLIRSMMKYNMDEEFKV